MAEAETIPDTQLGLTSDEISLLRHHQQVAASASGGNFSSAASRASAQSGLLLNGPSLEVLSRHFDRCIQQIQKRLDSLYEQSMATEQQNRDSISIPHTDAEIARLKELLRQIDELEDEFEKIRHIRDIVRTYRQRTEEMGRELDHKTTERVGKVTKVKHKVTVVKGGIVTTLEPTSTHIQRTPSDGEVEGHENPYTNHHQDSTRATQIGPSTDSGYASAAHANFEHGQVARPQDDTGNTQFLPHTDDQLGPVKNSLSDGVQISTSMESDDTKTIYSDASSVPNVESEGYIFELANDLMRKTRSEQPSPETIQRVIVILPKLLKAFSLKVGYNAPSQMHRDVMWFVHKNRE